MKARARKKRAYDASSRREEAERTTARIIEAASKLLHDVRPENLSYSDVAEASGVAVRTVYRHFPETSDLLRAVAQATIERFAAGGLASTPAAMAEQLGSFHRMMSEAPSLFRLFMAAPIRSELDYGSALKSVYAEAFEGLTPAQEPAVAGLIELLGSPFAWEVLHTHWQLPPERITRACLAAAQLIADGVRRHPDWLEPGKPTPPLFRPGTSARRKEKQ